MNPIGPKKDRHRANNVAISKMIRNVLPYFQYFRAEFVTHDEVFICVIYKGTPGFFLTCNHFVSVSKRMPLPVNAT